MKDQAFKSCLNKLTWASKEMAEAASTYAAWQYGESKTLGYACKDCGKWHLARDYDND